LLGLNEVEYSIGERVLFSDVTLNINPHDRFGLVGGNGSGKTTLLRIIKGEIAPTRGSVTRAGGLQIGYLPQEEIVIRGNRLIDEVLKDYHRHLERLAEIEKKIAADPHQGSLLKEYGLAQDEFHKIGGYDYETESFKVLGGLGFDPGDHEKPIQEFSSGWQMRAVLARMLLNRPGLLLLDEPTNHLDIESIEWLENYLLNFPGAMVVVSHDRYFLDKILQTEEGTSGIWEVDFHGFRRYRSDYTGYLVESRLHKERLSDMAKNQQRDIADLKDFIARNKANKKRIGVVRSREKQLDRMEIIRIPPERKRIRVHFPVEPIFSPQLVALRDISKAYDHRTVFRHVSLVIKNRDKIALIGKNGAGKSTLCRIIANSDLPTTGTRTGSEKLVIGAFSHDIMLQLDPERTVIDEALHDAPVEVHQGIRSYLGSFLFSGDDIYKKVRVLSGGEKTRLVILKTMLRPSNLLILDEPTYHLDKESVEVIRLAIDSYEGTIIFVTHDRELIADFATRVIEIKDGHLKDYPGDYEYYLWKRQQGPGTDDPRTVRAGKKTESIPDRDTAVDGKNALRQQIDQKQKRRDQLRETFSKPSFVSNPNKAKKLFAEYQRLADEIEDLEKRLTDGVI
jgi:ATP-binding cassette subfamily F protein 3